jgi:type I restriction enzyme S subunit
MNNGLPTGWAPIPLEELVSFRKGKKPRTETTDPQKGFVPYLDIQAIEKGRVSSYAEASSSRIGTPNDILVVWDGARSGWVGRGRNGAIGSTIMAIEPRAGDRDYIYRWLQTQFEHVNTNTRGTGIPHVDPEIFWNLEVPLAPLNEQRRLLAKLEQLLGKVDVSQQRLTKIPILLKRFRQSVLAAACSGRLTVSWRQVERDAESSAELLSKIGATVIQADGDIPETWCWGKFGELFTNYDGRRVPVKESDRAQRHGEYPYYGAFGVIDHVDDYLFDGEFLLLAEDGKNLESRLRPIAFRATGKFWVNNHAHVVQTKGNMPLGYFAAYFNSPSLDLAPFLTGIDQVKLNRKAMDRIPIPVPPIAEQNEIVRRVEELFALADQIEARYAKAKSYIDNLTQSILAKAFRGELVPQDPNDEPASALLERIRSAPRGSVRKQSARSRRSVASRAV